MKTHIITLTGFILAMLSQGNYASEPDLDSNPFLSDAVKKQENAVIFSFSKEPHRLPSTLKTTGSVSENEAANNYVERALKTKNDGFALVDSSDIANIDEWHENFQTQNVLFEHRIKQQILNQLSLDDQLYRANQFIADISYLKTVFDKAELTVITKHFGGNFIADKGWDQLTYIVSNALFCKMILEVFCFSEGAGVVMDSDAINYYVNTDPGTLYVLQDSKGNAHTQLSWLTNTCSYSIQLAKNVNAGGLQKPFKKLAQAISKS